jgi:plasmid maintenance system antidote protein VapI
MKLKIRAMERRVKGSDIASELGVVNSTVTAWLRADREVPVEYAVRLARMLDVPIREVLSPAVLEIVEVAEREHSQQGADT